MTSDNTSDGGKITLTYKLDDAPRGHLITAECPCCGEPLYVFVGDDGHVMEFYTKASPGHPDHTGEEG